jgi:hypothetical protein
MIIKRLFNFENRVLLTIKSLSHFAANDIPVIFCRGDIFNRRFYLFDLLLDLNILGR